MFEDIKRMSFRHKNNKPWYYVKNYIRQIFPSSLYASRLKKHLNQLEKQDKEYILDRVNYYNKLDEIQLLDQSIPTLADFKLKNYHQKVYFFDTFEYTRYFPTNLRISMLFGDITYIPDHPQITKSRPIDGDNRNSVVMKLVKIRHFLFLNDPKSFDQKKDILVFRGKAHQEHRLRFLEMYYKHPLCDIGQVNRKGVSRFPAPRLTISEHLEYKFILCLEGNDVASNLKWVMSSNSVAVMPKPKYETWFMEGRLIPNYHYILIKDDYSDLEEQLTYYTNHPEKALAIINQAHEYIHQFKDNKREDLISLLVLKKYIEMTGQKVEL